VADHRPAIYVYEQSVPAAAPRDGARRDGAPARRGHAAAGPRDRGQAGAPGRVLQRGLIGAVRLSPPGAGIVLPHEAVMPGPVRGRRELMEATQANLEPIFLLYDGSQAGIRAAGPAAAPAGASRDGRARGDGRGAATRRVDQIAAAR